MRIVSVLALASCNLRIPALEGHAEAPPFDCRQVALRDGLGDPDPCDVSACDACVRACGAACVIHDTYPPQYLCDDGGAIFEVYDSCPGWTLPQA